MIVSRRFIRGQQAKINKLYKERAQLILAQEALRDQTLLANEISNDAKLLAETERKERIALYDAFNTACETADKFAKENERLNKEINLIFNSQKKNVKILREAVNELCLKCGAYQQEHKGACNDCQWRELRNK